MLEAGGGDRGAGTPIAGLSDREREVLALTAQVLALTADGSSSAEIGKKLLLSPNTVDTYRARVMQKRGPTRRSRGNGLCEGGATQDTLDETNHNDPSIVNSAPFRSS